MVILLTAMAFVVINTGCGGLHRYDGRLVAADSLIQASPDSALAIVSAIDSLVTEGDRAYRDLLLTQARYKTYQDITAGDDSAVTRAMAWYRAHSGEREKLTRAYLYKGAVMQELGHVDSAMYYYKTAEVTADPKDYANLGQINTRIGDLYRLYYTDPERCYDLFKQALKYYRLTGNKRLQYDCLLNMGGCSGIIRIGDPEHLLAEASQLATELDDSAKYYQSQELLCRQLEFYGDSIPKAKQIAFHCLNNYGQFINVDLMLDLADIYVKSGMPDSAIYYLDLVTENASMNNFEQVQTRKYLILSEIAQLEGDTISYIRYDMLSHQVSDSIINSEQRYQIQHIENSFNSHQYTSVLSKISRLQWVIIVLAAVAILVITLLIVEHLRRMYRTKAIIKELQHINSDKYELLLSQLDDKSSVVEKMLSNIVALIKTLSGNETQNSTSYVEQQIQKTISDVADDRFWDELRSYLDKKHNGLISYLAQTHNLKEKDLQFIELSCCGFSYAVIAIIMDYSPRYVFNKRKILASRMGLDMPFQEYLDCLLDD